MTLSHNVLGSPSTEEEKRGSSFSMSHFHEERVDSSTSSLIDTEVTRERDVVAEVHHSIVDETSPSTGDESAEDRFYDSDIDEITTGETVPSEDQKKKQAYRAVLLEEAARRQETEDSSDDELSDTVQPFASPAAKKMACESAVIIDKARDYQQELFERAKEDNILAVLDTGSGKTLIACLLIKHILSQEMSECKSINPPRTVFFLANSVHLVIQQGQVLESNLAQPPAVLYGNGKENLWKGETWESILQKSRTVVCTADVLIHALFHNYVSMSAISLLIFDECHHAKKGHAYARIMLDYYFGSDHSLPRPKIFGMTASPVDTKGNMMKASGDLEILLDSKIVTTASLSLLEHAPRARNEEWAYERLRYPFDTDLTLGIKRACDIEELRQPLQFAHYASSALGRWSVDQMWKYVFSIKETKSLVKRYERSKAYQDIVEAEDREAKLNAIEKVAQLVQAHKFTHAPNLTNGDLSSKVIVLIQQLQQRYFDSPELRTIVFVEQRLTAEILVDCMIALEIPNLKPAVLVGSNRASKTYVAEESLSNKQLVVMEYFRAGWINCVFATNVAEEGIDIPQCSLVVRFDLFKTPIQYMQSRGRARMKNSIYAMLIESGNEEQRKEIDYVVEYEEYIRLVCSKMPEDRLLVTTAARLRKMIEKHAGLDHIKMSGGARCSLNESLVILARYASSLQNKGSITSDVHYELSIKHDQFRYTVRLSDGSESLGREKILGKWMPNKALAKRSAAWHCCYELRRRRMLDENFDSIHVRKQHKNNNAKWAVGNKGEKYEMKIKPDFWDRGTSVPSELYPSVVRLVPSRRMKHTLRPFVLFSRQAIPEIPRFVIYLEDKVSVEVAFDRLLTPISLTLEQLEDMTTYTLRCVFDDVFGKKYEHDTNAMTYWLAPQNPSMSAITSCSQFDEIVNVAELRAGLENRVSWIPGTSGVDWCQKFLVDKWTGAFRYISYDIVPGATVDTPVPETALIIGKKRKQNVAEFTSSLFNRSWERTSKELDVDQPVFDCELFLARRDFLDVSNEKENTKNVIKCYAIPQPLEVGRLSPDMAFSFMSWPSILHRLESYLITLEAFHKLDLEIPADLALEAFTATGDNDDGGDQTQSTSLRGMGKNYERLEFIGDSLLKMTTTISVFCIKNKAAESDLHCDRMQMLCNNNLFSVSVGETLQLYQYARTTGLNRTTWYPEGLILTRGRGAKENPSPVQHNKVYQNLGKKTIADISEAIIGASYQARRGFPDRFDMGLRAITLLVRDAYHPMCKWSEIAPLYKPPTWQLQTNDPLALDLANKVEQSVDIGYHFKYPRLVRSALTHGSDMNSPVPDYQRLEFLGDAVLDMVSISWMFNKYDDKNPQWLTEHKMAMVSNKFLAALAVTLDLDKLMIANNVALCSHVAEYARRVREMWELGKENIARDFWTEMENEPKSLSDLVEAYVGALMVDSGFQYELVERFFEKHILWFFEDLELYSGFANRHPTTYLYHKLTDEFHCAEYAVDCIELSGTLDVKIMAGVLIHRKVIASAKAKSSRYARVAVSKMALRRLDGMTIEQFRTEFNCDCKIKADVKAAIETKEGVLA